jgi:fructose-1,6-bisphosphatase I
MTPERMTLRRQVRDQHGGDPGEAADLADLLERAASAAKSLTRGIRRAAFSGGLGLAGEINATGDAQKKLDVLADETVLAAFAPSGLVAAVVSEELEDARRLAEGEKARYLLCIDPLDGSSNSDINGSVGTVFGLYRRQGTGPLQTPRDLLRRGSEQVAAGYVLYGPATLMVYTTGHGVWGFTLDEEKGEFVLTHERLRCPGRGRYYSANLGNLRRWHPNIQRYVDHLTSGDPAKGRPGSLRYTGALVADLHRSLIDGGLYFYPADTGHANGKLRLLYECAPLALVVEQAGGRASTGTERVLDIQAESIHQRVPLVIGSAEDVALYETFMKNGGAPR